MDDMKIIDMYWNRDENAIHETDIKYRKYLVKTSYNILERIEDCYEVLNDTYLNTWTSIPDNRPDNFAAYLSRITRSLSIDKYRKNNSQKRGGNYSISLEELSECVGTEKTPQEEIEYKLLVESLNRFLGSLPKEKRDIFMCRYFFVDSIESISKNTGYSTSKVKSILFRIRNKLREHLQKEGFVL